MADRETIITSGDGTGSMGTGVLVAIILVLILLVAGGYIAINHGASNSVTVDVPKVTVTAPAKN